MYQIAKDFRLPSRSADRSIAGLYDCRHDAEGGRRDERDFERERPQANQSPGNPRQQRGNAAKCQQAGDSDAKSRVLAKPGVAKRPWRDEKQDAREKERESAEK